MLTRRGLFHVPFLIRNSEDGPKTTNLVGSAFEESFRVDGSHAPGAGGSDGLAIHVILHVTTRENSPERLCSCRRELRCSRRGLNPISRQKVWYSAHGRWR